jgi:secretory phospholipase A2
VSFVILFHALKEFEMQVSFLFFAFLNKAVNGLIMYGTDYCGGGQTSDAGENPVKFPKADACCKGHDECTVRINAWSKKFHLINWYPWSINSCACNDAFHKCLKDADTNASWVVGNLYFKFPKKKCYTLGPGSYCYDRSWKLKWDWKFWEDFGKCVKTGFSDEVAELRDNLKF